MTDEDEFYAWLDGELDEAAAARVAARVAADPALETLAAEHRAMTASLRGAFAGVLDEPSASPRFETAEVVDFAARRTAAPARRTHLPRWAAIAATLVVGIVAGRMIPSSAPIESRGGTLYAAASLDRALDRQLASTQGAGGDVRIGLSFRDRDGQACRSFSGAAGQGLACRRGDDWAIEGLFAAPVAGGDYRMAAGEDPKLAALIDERIAGEPFDAAAEAAALKGDWR